MNFLVCEGVWLRQQTKQRERPQHRPNKRGYLTTGKSCQRFLFLVRHNCHEKKRGGYKASTRKAGQPPTPIQLTQPIQLSSAPSLLTAHISQSHSFPTYGPHLTTSLLPYLCSTSHKSPGVLIQKFNAMTPTSGSVISRSLHSRNPSKFNAALLRSC